MESSNKKEVKEGLIRVAGFLLVALLIALIGSTGHWSIILATPLLVGAFAYLASGGDMKWVLRSTVLGLIAGIAWYLTY